MAVLHFHHGDLNQRCQPHQPHRQAMRSWQKEPGASGLAHGIMLTGIGLAALAGFAGAEFTDAAPIGSFLFLLGCPFLLFGGLLLLFASLETIFRRLKRIQSHCGRCRFYRALDEGYALGRCRVDPHQRVIHRTALCQFFEYSERAMVRDRFAQQAEMAPRSQK